MKFRGIGFGRIVIFLLTETSRIVIVFLWIGEIVLTKKVNIYGVNYVGGRLY